MLLKNVKEKLTRVKISNWTILVIIIALVALVLAPSLFFSSTFFTNLDNVDQFYSWYSKLSISLHHGELPIWNANTLGGQSFVGEVQQGVFYPINIAFVWLFGSASGISQRALDFLMAIHFIIGAFGVYLVSKKFKISNASAVLAGLLYVFSGAVVSRAASQSAIFFGLCILPYSLFYLIKYYESGMSKRWLLAIGASLGIIILSGHIQPFFHAVVILAVYEVSKYIPLKKPYLKSMVRIVRELILRYSVVFATLFIVILPQAWLTYQYFPNAYRVQAEGYQSPEVKLKYSQYSKAFNIDPGEVANLIEPSSYPAKDGNNLYIGLAPLLIIILVIALGRKQLKQSSFWKSNSNFILIVFTIGVLAVIGYWTWFAVLLYEFPFIKQVRQLGRYSILIHIIMVMMFAAGLDIVKKIRFTPKQIFWLYISGVFLLINSLYLYLLRGRIFNVHFATQNLLLAAVLLILAAIKIEKIRYIALIVVFILVNLANGLWFYPKVFPGVRVVNDYKLEQNLVKLFESTDGKYRVEIQNNSLPVNIANAYDFQTTGGYGATIYTPYFEFSHNLNLSPEFRQDLLGVYYSVDKTYDGKSELVYKDTDKGIFVVKRPTALTKLFTTSKNGSTNREDYSSLDVQEVEYLDHYQSYKVKLKENTRVIMSEVNYPNWHLKVDGKSQDWHAYTVNGTGVFRSFDLSAGEHNVVFEYKPFGI